MTPRKKTGYYTKLDPALREIMRQYKDATGIPEAQMVDRALREWLGARGVITVTGRYNRVGKIGEVVPDVLPPRERRVKKVKR